jgi:putative glycerol-1-phosphate prenyltransferase
MSIHNEPDIYTRILSGPGKKISVLIDPDKHTEKSLLQLIEYADISKVDFFLVGGSLLLMPIGQTINFIKTHTKTPVILFPGNLLQLSEIADALLLLSLISGRNPDLLIGNHVIAAPIIRKSGIQTIPTGYLLIETGKTTSVEYISNTRPIPSDKTEIAVATAMAGEMLGLKMIYLDAGSGAENPVPFEMIKQVKENINVPLIIGGGIRSEKQLISVCENGADIVVLGNILEKNARLISGFSEIVHAY